MDQGTDEELEVVFQFGQWKVYSGNPMIFGKQKYSHVRNSARMLGIDLPDRPPEETTTKDEMKQFLCNQFYRVEDYVEQHKSCDIHQIFLVGDCVERLLSALHVVCNEAFEENETLRNENVREVRTLVRELRTRAESRGIDISEELSKVNVRQPELDENAQYLLELGLKKKLCKRVDKSEVDPNRIITDECWLISLARLPDRGNRQHAFLVLEGKTGNKLMIWFVDFVANNPFDLVRPGMKDGKVRMKNYESEAVVGSSSKLLFQCDRKIMDIRYGDRLLHSSWSIVKSTAVRLIQNIKAQQNNPPKYNLLGDSMLAASSATSSGNPTGHNCFTFVRMMLRDLNTENIKIPQDNLDKWIYSAASRFLVDNQLNNQRSHTLLFQLLIFLAVAVIAFLFLKLLNL